MIDVATHFQLNANPFANGEGEPVAAAGFTRALDELMAALRGGARLIAVEGEAGSGTTRLLRAAAERVEADGVRVRLIEHARLAEVESDAGVLLVDEADALDAGATARLLARAGAPGDGAVVLALAPGGGAALPAPARVVALAALSPDESARFIAEQSARAGRPDLFTPAAAATVARSAGGSPRLLRRLAGLALVEAALDEAGRVEETHAAAAAARGMPGVALSPPPPPRVEPNPLDVAPRSAPPPSRGAAAPVPVGPPHEPQAPRGTRRRDAARALAAVAAIVLALLLALPSLRGLLEAPTVRTAEPRARPAAAAARAPRAAAPVARGIDEDAGGGAIIEASDDAERARAAVPLERDTEPPVALPAEEPPPESPPARDLARIEAPGIEASVRREPPPAARDEPPALASPTRVFIHHLPADADAAEALAGALRARGWEIAGLRAVRTVVSRPNARHFHGVDGAAARELADDLADTLGEPAGVRDLRGFGRPPRPGTLEIWLPSLDGER